MALNGRLSNDDLGYIPGTGHRVRADLVAQTAALRAAFAARFGKPLSITDAYRSYNEQVRIFTERYVRTPLPGRPSKVWNGVRYWQKPGTAMAATPGTSNHGWAQAIDFGSRVNVQGSEEHLWLREHGPKFGYSWPSWWAQSAREWWHFEAVPALTSQYKPFLTELGIGEPPNVQAPDPLTPVLPEQEDDLMVIIQRNNANGSKSLVAGGGWRGPLGPYSVQALEALGVETKILTTTDYDTILALLPEIKVAA